MHMRHSYDTDDYKPGYLRRPERVMAVLYAGNGQRLVRVSINEETVKGVAELMLREPVPGDTIDADLDAGERRALRRIALSART